MSTAWSEVIFSSWMCDGSIARNRYRWFGRAEYCVRLTPEQRARLL
jgi:predicted DCC family thiol-disulfide oxidoreductase YuxK